MLSTKSNYSFPRFIIIQIPKVFGDEKVDVDSTDRHASVWYSVVVLGTRVDSDWSITEKMALSPFHVALALATYIMATHNSEDDLGSLIFFRYRRFATTHSSKNGKILITSKAKMNVF